MKKLHLGCGLQVFPGWDNLDIDPRKPGVIKQDLTKPLVYPDNSVDFIYNEHFIEHITDDQGTLFLNECFRVLKKGGYLRISCPDLELHVQDYVNNFLFRYKSINLNFRNKCHFLNSACRDWAHLYLYDEEDLSQKLKNIGFKGISRKKYHQSDIEEFKNLETRANFEELILEARK